MHHRPAHRPARRPARLPARLPARRSPRRASRLAALLALGIGAGVLGGCGAGSEDLDPDPAAGTDSSSTEGSSGQADAAEVIAVLTHSDAGGRVTTRPTRIDDRLSALRYTSRFRDDRSRRGDDLAEEILEVVAEHTPTDGAALTATVIRVGCGAPVGVEITVVDGRARVADGGPPGDVECLVAETTVAIVEIPTDLLPSRPDPERSAVGD